MVEENDGSPEVISPDIKSPRVAIYSTRQVSMANTIAQKLMSKQPLARSLEPVCSI